MAINPLFSGPGQSLSPVLVPSRFSVRVSSMAHSAPCKKPRIGMCSDPFQDFEESFTADELETIDLIESQALSQRPTSSKIGESSTKNMPVAGAVSQSGKFNFKSRSTSIPSTSSLSRKVANRQPTSTSSRQVTQPVRQTNVQYGGPMPSKVYLGNHSSPSQSQQNHNSSPPFPSQSSQNRFRISGIESQPTNKNARLQQTNVVLSNRSQDSPQSQGFGTSELASTAHGTPSTSTYSSVKPTKSHAQSTTGNEVRYNLSAQTMRQGGSSKALTPPAGCTSSGSPDLPTKAQETTFIQQQLEKITAECEKYKEELNSLKSERYSKDGEIQVLRQNLGKSKAEVGRLKVEKIEQEEKWRREQSDKEKELAREAESLKTQLQFKERELAEAQTSYRSLEQRLQTTNNVQAHNPITPPRNSPRFSRSAMQVKSEQLSPKPENGFPTHQSFMEKNPAIGSPARVRLKLVGAEDSRGSRSPKRSAARSPARSPKVPATKISRPGSSRAPERRTVPSSSNKMCISSKYCKGQISPAQLVGALMNGPSNQTYGQASPTRAALISSLQASNVTSDRGHALKNDESGKPVADPSNRLDIAVTCASTSNTISPLIRQNRESALRAISTLLTSSNQDSTQAKSTSSVTGPSLQHKLFSVADSSTAVIGMLPMLEDQLMQYLDAAHLLNVCSSSLASTCPSTVTTRSADSSPESVSSAEREEQYRFEKSEEVAVNALQTLYCLVCHSQAVCSHILRASGDRSVTRDADASLMEIDPSAPLIDPTQAPGPSSRLTSNSNNCSPPSIPPHPQYPNCLLLERLVKICSVQSSEKHGNIIIDTALRILLELAKRLEDDSSFRYNDLLASDVFHHNLSSNSSCSNACLVLAILTALSHSWTLTQKMCNQSDSCILLQVYQCACQGVGKASSEQMIELASKIIDLLTNIVTIHEEGAAFLLDTDCQCSVEVVPSIIIMLSREYSVLDQDQTADNKRLGVIRQGLPPLHALFLDSRVTDHKQEVEPQYNHLITEMNRLLQRLPELPKHEVCLLQDFEGFDDEDWDQDGDQMSQEPDTQMDVN